VCRRRSVVYTKGVFDTGHFPWPELSGCKFMCLICFYCSSVRLPRCKNHSLSCLSGNALEFRFIGARSVLCLCEPQARIRLPPFHPPSPSQRHLHAPSSSSPARSTRALRAVCCTNSPVPAASPASSNRRPRRQLPLFPCEQVCAGKLQVSASSPAGGPAIGGPARDRWLPHAPARARTGAAGGAPRCDEGPPRRAREAELLLFLAVTCTRGLPSPAACSSVRTESSYSGLPLSHPLSFFLCISPNFLCLLVLGVPSNCSIQCRKERTEGNFTPSFMQGYRTHVYHKSNTILTWPD
jgi:hypothetical protein